MTLYSLVEHLRFNILHDTGGTGVDWGGLSESDYDSIQLRWTNEELTRNINEAINQVYRRSNPIKSQVFLSVTEGVSDYKLKEYILKVIGVKTEDGIALTEKSIDSLWDLPSSTSLKTAYFSTDTTTGIISFYDPPLKDETFSLMVYRLPINKLSWDDFEASPELRSEYQIPMLYYAAHLCYLKDEANTIDPSRAALFSGLFDKEFPHTSVYSNIRKSRTANRSIRYGGL